MAKQVSRKDRWQLLARFTDWLYIRDDSPPPPEVMKLLNHKMLISMLFKVQGTNKFVNQFLNNNQVYSIPIEELARFMKKLVQRFGVPRNKIWWFANLELREKLDRIKLIKPYEKQFLSEWMKQGIISDLEPKPVKARKRKLESDVKNLVESVKQTNPVDAGKSKLETLRDTFISSKQNDESCKQCGLYNRPIVTFDSNDKTVSNIDVLFVAEAPGETEVELGLPLIGRSGQLFRSYLERYISDSFNFFITNTCLCRPEDNRAPTDQEIACCSNKLDRIIEETNPKIIVALGTIPMKRLTGLQSGITKERGSIKQYKHPNGKNYDVFITVHPSYIIRNMSNNFMYDEDFSTLRNYLISEANTVSYEPETKTSSSIFSIELEEKYYTDYDLVNITKSFSKEKGLQIVYLFRHKKTKQLEVYKTNPIFYYYKLNRFGKHVLLNHEVNELLSNGSLVLEYNKPIFNGFDGKFTYYEGDLQYESKHSIDYYYQLDRRELQNEYQPRICYIDIEVYSSIFPEPKLAKAPITLITTKYIKENQEKNYVYILGTEDEFKITNDDEYLKVIDKYEKKYFSSEEDLLLSFIEDLHNEDIDIIAAWNVSFDIGYIYHRLKKLKLNPDLLSKFYGKDNDLQTCEIDLDKHRLSVPGYIVLDLLSTYRFVSYGNRESYSLDYIVRYEGLETKGKKFKGSKFNVLWDTNKQYALAYNIEDVELIKRLDDKIALTNFVNEYRKVTVVPWEHIQSTARTSDSLIMFFAKKKNMLIRNKVAGQSGDGEKIGAYVYQPQPGIHEFVFEADFKSLYPSIIQTFNIGPTTYVAKFVDSVGGVIDYLKGDKDSKFTLILDPIYNPTPKAFTYEELKNWITQNNYIIALGGGIFKNHNEELSILADVIAYLKERRVYYQKLYEQTESKMYYLFQLAYKIALNALYGFLGFDGSRFKHVDLVNNVTLSGQLINKFSALTFAKLLELELGEVEHV